MTDQPKPNPLAGIEALLAERQSCQDRIAAIDEELRAIRQKIDLRTAPVTPRKPRLVAEKANAPVVEVPEPPEAA